MNYQFFLGGYDLEMHTIKELLLENEYPAFDKNLKWGAKFSDYQDEINGLNADMTPVFIELEQDIPLQSNAVVIDHHGKYSDKKSSLEQIAELLDIELTRYQKLVAANDSGYISGMHSLCATDAEIKQIRMEDKIAQGVTEQDEKLALKSIIESDGSLYLYSYTSHFSTVSDLVYGKHSRYVIYNDQKIVFYGYEVQKILEFLEQREVTDAHRYYGGGDFGFVGIKEGIFQKDEIERLVKEYEKLNQEYSYHIFMFPFIFKNEDKKEILKDWIFEPYIEKYNETAYFHKFFRDTMFTDKEESGAVYTQKPKSTEVKIKKSKEYVLVLEKMSLKIFETGIGILSFHIKNHNHPEVEAILEINDYGRRLFPEYLDDNLRCSLVPESITINGVTESFCYTTNPNKPEFSKIITSLIPAKKITSAIDDRMFVISYYLNKTVMDDLKRDYERNDSWYQYVFVDGNGKTVQNSQMQQDLINKSTYARWQGYGTMYGVTRYSFVCLADSLFSLEHIKTIYFQMFSLLLMVRATTLKFSGEVASITNKLEESNDDKKIQELYRRYINFVSRFYFREVTAKEQGIEIYEKALELLKIERDVKDLDNEIAELFSYTDMTKQAQLNESVAKLNRHGIPLMVASLIAGVFGMNTILFEDLNLGMWSQVLIMVAVTWIVSKLLGGKK